MNELIQRPEGVILTVRLSLTVSKDLNNGQIDSIKPTRRVNSRNPSIKLLDIHGVIYLQMFVMKKLLPVLRPVALLGIGLIMAVLSAAVGTVSPDMSGNNMLAAAQSLQTASPTPIAAEGTSRIGSTDGIVLMGIVIVVIVIMPIWLRRKTWAK